MHITIERDRARTLRKNMTRAEIMLWSKLQRRGLAGFRFNRQVEIAPYIADFLCRARKVILEVDGATHSDMTEIAYDQRRTRYLEEKGFVVHRVTNADIYGNMQGVLDGLLKILTEASPSCEAWGSGAQRRGGVSSQRKSRL